MLREGPVVGSTRPRDHQPQTRPASPPSIVPAAAPGRRIPRPTARMSSPIARQPWNAGPCHG